MNCPICNADDFEDLDTIRSPAPWIEGNFLDYRKPKVGFVACRSCGHFTYRNDRDLSAHYKGRYRKYVTAEGNIVTCSRKWQYHGHFLSDQFQPDKGKRVVDFGCAFGFNLLQFRESGCDVKGYELTDGFVRYGQRIFGLEIAQEWDEAPGSADLIMCYHTLEHLEDPVGQLVRFREALKDDGILYLAVPYWFEVIEEGGGGEATDFEHLYHIDHIQVFSREAILNCFRRAGFRVVKTDDQIYGLSFALRKGDVEPISPEPWKDKFETVKKQKEAIRLFAEAKSGAQPNTDVFLPALKAWRDFPDAWINHAETRMQDFGAKLAILLEGLKTCGSRWKIVNALAAHYLQWDEDAKEGKPWYSNNVKKSEDLFRELMRYKPGNEYSLHALGMIEYQYKKNPQAAVQWWLKLAQVNPSRWAEVQTLIGRASASEHWESPPS